MAKDNFNLDNFPDSQITPNDCEDVQITKPKDLQSIMDSHPTQGFNSPITMLPINIARFNDFRQKVNTPIDIPKKLKIKVLENGREIEKELSLRSVVIHHGKTIQYGHYYSYSPHQDNSWTLYNDSQVSKKNENEIINDIQQNATVAIYEEGPLPEPINQQQPAAPKQNNRSKTRTRGLL